MRVSIILLAIVLFLTGLSQLGAIVLSGGVMGWLDIIDAALFLLELGIPPAISYFRSRSA
jgi:hypothetical protein